MRGVYGCCAKFCPKPDYYPPLVLVGLGLGVGVRLALGNHMAMGGVTWETKLLSNLTYNKLFLLSEGRALIHLFTFIFLLFSHLADAFIQSDLQIRNSNYNYKLKLYKYYIHTFKKMEKLNKMTNAYNNISKLNI